MGKLDLLKTLQHCFISDRLNGHFNYCSRFSVLDSGFKYRNLFEIIFFLSLNSANSVKVFRKNSNDYEKVLTAYKMS